MRLWCDCDFDVTEYEQQTQKQKKHIRSNCKQTNFCFHFDDKSKVNSQKHKIQEWRVGIVIKWNDSDIVKNTNEYDIVIASVLPIFAC